MRLRRGVQKLGIRWATSLPFMNPPNRAPLFTGYPASSTRDVSVGPRPALLHSFKFPPLPRYHACLRDRDRTQSLSTIRPVMSRLLACSLAFTWRLFCLESQDAALRSGQTRGIPLFFCCRFTKGDRC